jgi:hypothetical protein
MHLSGGHRATVAALLVALLIAGCAGVKQSVTPAVPAIMPVAPTAAPDAAGGSPTASAPSAPAATAPPSQAAAVPSAPGQAAAKPAAKPAAPEAKAPAKPAAAAPPSAKAAAAAPVAKAAAPPLDLKALETELKETKAIGVMTKLSIKNQVDDLLSQFRAFYQGKLKITLAELRRPCDLLVLKLLSLLQDSDPTLAAAIVASREAIWGILSDRTKFASLDGG